MVRGSVISFLQNNKPYGHNNQHQAGNKFQNLSNDMFGCFSTQVKTEHRHQKRNYNQKQHLGKPTVIHQF